MKLHLPVRLFRAVIALMAAVPAFTQAYDIPEEYDQLIDLWTPSYIFDHISNTAEDYKAFSLYTDIEFNPTANTTWTATTPLVTGGNLIFTTAAGYAPMALSFADGANRAFLINTPTTLTFDTLRHLEFANINRQEQATSSTYKFYGAAVYLGANAALSIHQVNDATEDTPDVLFSGNQLQVTNYSYTPYAYGGAIYGTSGSSIDISGNGDVAFNNNLAYSTYTTNSASSSYSYGGAIYTTGSTTLSDNGDITFSSNRSSSSSHSYNYTYTYTYSRGGAIYTTGSTLFSGNGDITFSSNRSSSSSSSYYYNYSREALSYGGAVYAAGKWDMSGNGDITFDKNYASAKSTSAASTSSSSSSYSVKALGGAIYSTADINLTNNADINFSGNYTTADRHRDTSYNTSYSQGGAIYSTGTLSICNNTDVTFSGNYTDNKYSGYNEGGAIYSTGSIIITGNDDVVFEKNYERIGVSSYTYRLRSIYMDPDASTDILTLSAKEGKSITFYDSVYLDSGYTNTIKFNSDYVDADGVTQKATGDIIFSGAKAAEHLAEIKGSAATSSELTNSQTTEIYNAITLYGGTLQVVDGANFNGYDLTLAANSNSKLLMRDATMSRGNNDIYFNNDTELELQGYNNVTAWMYLNNGSVLTTSVGAGNRTTAALTLTGNLFTYQHTINLERTDGLTSGMFKVITLAGGSSYFQTSGNWTAAKVTVNGSGYADRMIFSDLVWKDGTLYYNVGRNIWSNVSEDRLWNGTSDNWTMNARSYTYIDGMDVYFTDTGAGQVKLVGDINPATIEVNNATGKDYHFTAAEGGGKLVGATGILKNGAGALTIDTANEHTGATVLNTGTLNVHHSTALGATASAATATVTTKTGTLLAVDKDSHLVLAGENDMAGAVSVAEGSTLELRNTGYHAESSSIDGTLHFRGETTAMSNVGTLSGKGTVKVEDSNMTFSQQTGYTGNLIVQGENAKLAITQGHYNAAGYISLNGEGAALNMSGNNIDMKAGGSMSMVTTGTATTVSANNVRFAAGAGLSVRHDGSTDALTLSCFNESVAGTLSVAKLTLDSGSSYTADGGHLNLNNGELTLAITPTATQKIHLTLTAGQDYNSDMRVCLFSGVKTLNFIYDGITTTTTSYTLDAEDYFSGDWINADTELIFENGSLYLSWVNSVGVASDTVAWNNATGDSCWNTTSQNWMMDSVGGVYKNNLAVVFGDAGAGEITLEGNISPANVLVNNSYGSDYSWVGSGSLQGSMSLTKQGAGTLTIETENSYRGGTVIEGGTLVAAHADALGTGVIQLNGGTLVIGAAGIDNTIRSAGRSTLAVSEGVTHELLDTINNNGTLSMSGSYKADALGEMTQLGAISLVNAAGEADTTGGFNKSALQGVQIATGSTVDLGASITHGNNVLHLGTDGWATMGGLVEYSGYLVGSKHSVKLSDITAAATAGGTSMTNIQLNGGTLTADSALTGVLAASGTSTIVAQDWAVSHAFSNSGTLNISGSIVADGIENVEVIGATHVAADGSIGASGFSKNDGSKFTLVLGGGVSASNLTITRDGLVYKLGSDGVAVADGAVAYGRYLVGNQHSVKLSDIVTAAVVNGVSKTHVDVNGGTLTLDRALTGSLSAAGNSTLIAQNWAVTEAIANSGELSLRGTVIADAMDVSTIGATYVDAAGHVGEHGFTRAEGYQFTLVDGGSLVDKGVHITRNGVEYELGSDGVAVAHGAVAYGSYIIGAGHAVKLSEIVNVAAAHGVSATEIVLNGGTLTADAALTGLLSIGGESTIVAQNFTLLGTIANSGVLTLSGTVDASKIQLIETSAAREDLNGNVVEANQSGFAKAKSYSALLVEGGEVVNKGLVIDHSGLKPGLSLQLGSDGVAHAGGAVDYSTYYLTGQGVADVLGIGIAAQKKGGQLQDISMDGGTLTVNADATVTATGGAILLNGGVLSGHLSGAVVHAAEGSLDASLLGGNTLVGNNFALDKVILNSGSLTVSGSFDVSALTLNSTAISYVDASGKVGNSGFLKGAESSVLVISGGTVNGLATVKHNGLSLTLGPDGYARTGGSVAYGTYYLNGGDSVSVQAAEAASANALTTVSMSGGVLYADASTNVQATGGSIMLSSGTLMGSVRNTAVSASAGTLNAALSGSSSLTLSGTVTVSGTNSHSGGTVLTGGNFTLSNASALGTGSVIATGSNVLQAGTTISLKSAIFNNGELTLNGSYDVSALSLQSLGSGYIDAAGNMGESGFAKSDGYSVLVVSGGSVTGNATIKHGELSLTLGSDGYATAGGGVEYATYYLNSGDSVSVLAAERASSNALTTVSMNGGTLYADASTTVNSAGGSIVLSNGTLSGTVNNAVVSATNGTLSAELTGSTSVQVNGSVTLSGDNSHTGGTIINGGTLTLTDSAALGNGSLLNKGTSMLKADAVMALSEAIINNGTLTLSGAYDVSALNIITAGAVRLDVNGNEGNSGFLKSGGSKVLVVNGGEVINSGAVVTHKGTSLTLGSDGYATTGGSINYSEYLLTGADVATTSQIHRMSGSASITQTGGTLTVDDASTVATTNGIISLADGTLSGTVSGATINAAKGAIAATLNGSNTLVGYDYGIDSPLRNNGVLTLSGTFTVNQLTTNDATTYVGLDNRNGVDGFRKSAYMVATLATGTTADAGAVITYNDTVLKLRADGTAYAGGEVDYSTFYLNSGSASSLAIHGKSAACGITVAGGSLTVNDTATVHATAGNVNLNGGVLLGSLENTTLTLTRGTLDATVTGGSVIGSNYVLTEALELNGTVNIGGSFDASALELITTDRARVDVVTGNSGESGFLKLGDSRVQVISGGELQIDSNTSVKYNGLNLTLGNDGYASAGGTTDYSTYLLTGSDSVNVQSVLNAAPTAAIEMNGGTLTVDAALDKLTATGGTIELGSNVKLGGTLSGTTIHASTGTLAATLTGSNTLVGNNYVLGTVLNNSGVLTLSGSFTVSALTTDEEACYIGLSNSVAADGFRKSAHMVATIATGTTADAGATISYNGTLLQLNTDGTASVGGDIDYSRFYLNAGSANTQAIHAKSAGCGIVVAGGTLTVNDIATVTATGGKVVLNGGTLQGSLENTSLTLSGGSLLATVNGGSLVGNNYVLSGMIQLNGAVSVSGSFNATSLDLISEGSTRVDTYGNSGASGFVKAGEMRVKVLNGGTLSVASGTTVIHGGHTLTLGSNGYATGGGVVDYSEYLLTGTDTARASDIYSKNSSALITQTGGSLFADTTASVTATGGSIVLSSGALNGTAQNTAVSATGGSVNALLSGTSSLSARGTVTLTGANTHTGGTIFSGGTITLSHADALGNGSLQTSGINTVKATTSVNLDYVIANSGTLTLNGNFNAANLTLNEIDACYVDANGNVSDSGFSKASGYSVQVVNGGSVIGGATIKHGSHTLTLGSDGYATSGGSITYGTYYLNGADSVSVSEAELASANALTSVNMTGGTLYADASTKVTATGGNILLSSGTLSGTVNNAMVNATGGTLSAVLSGSATLSATGSVTISGANSHTGGSMFRGGSFTLTQTSALGNGVVMTSGTNTLTATTVVKLNSAILNSGALTMTGTYNGSGLSLETLDGGYVDANGIAGGSGFLSAGGYRVLVVNGGTVSGGATISHGSHSLVLGADGYATGGGSVAYDTYYLNGSDSVKVSEAEIASSNRLTAVTMTGGTLYADAGTKVTATGGNIQLSNGTLSGTVTNTAVNATAGTLSATLSGSSSLSATGTVTISGANSHTGGSMFRGGSFTLSQASALGNGIVMTSGTNTIAASTTVTLNSMIVNSGALTLTGTYNASALTLNTLGSTYVDIDGNAGVSGFSKASGYSVQVVNGGTVSGGATIKHGSHTLTLGSDGYATGGGGITYSTYYLNGSDSVKVSEAEQASSNALTAVTMKGGMLYADASTKVTATGGNIQLSSGTLSGTIKDTAVNATAGTLSAALSGSSTLMATGTVTLSGSNTHTGGTMFNGGTFTLSNANALGSGAVMTTGTNTLKGNTAQSLKSTILNSGTLTLSGSWNLSALALNTQAATRVDVDGRTGESGFGKSALYEVQMVQGGTTKASGLSLTHNRLDSGLQLTLGSNGVATAGGVVDYNTYYLTGRDSVSVSEAKSASGSLLNNVVMSGGNLTADASTKLTATGGSITVTDDATLSGTITNTDITFDRGSYSADITANITGDGSLTINGGEVTLSGNNSYTGGTIINGGSLTAVDKAVLGSGSITVNGGTLDLNNQQVGNDITLNNGTLTGNDNYNGNLSIGGDNVAVEGGYTLGAGKVLEIAAGGTEFGSDLTLSGGTLLFKGAPLTVDGEVSFATGTTTLVDLRSWEGQLTNGLTLAVLGTDVTGWADGCLELIGMSNMELLFDDSTGSLTLQIAGAAPVAEVITWLGAKGAVWQTGRAGWMNATTGYDAVFDKGADVIFTQPGAVTIAGAVEPGSVIVAGDKAITFKADKLNPGRIVGEGSLTKRGNGKLTLNDGNTYSGGTFIEAGTVTAGGANSFGRGDITISGGTLDLKGKAVANDITLTGAATIKGGKLYGGSFTMDGDLLNGSLLNIGAGETATLVSGTLNGTISGTGTVSVMGDAAIGTTAKVTTNELEVSGSLAVGSKGLAMNTKTSAIIVKSGGQLISEGALKAAALTVDSGLLELNSSAKASSIAITNNMGLSNGAEVTVFANVKTGNLSMTGSQLTLAPHQRNTWAFRPSAGGGSGASAVAALSLTVSGHMNLTSSALTLSGKISAGNLSIVDSYVNMTSNKLQTIAVKNTLTISGNNSFIFDFDATNGGSYKLFTFAGFNSDGTALHELFGWEQNGSYTLTANAKDITLTVLNAVDWANYMDELANSGAVSTLSEDDELVESAGAEVEVKQIVVTAPAAGINPLQGKVADTLVQSTWGTAGASRSFGDTIAARGTHATALAEGKAAAWISTMGGSSRLSSDGGHSGADYTLTGAAFGMETSLSEKSTVGLAIGNSWGKVSTFSAFPVDQDSTHQGIYGKHLLGSSTTLSWMAAHTRTESDAKLAGMACDWTQDALQLDARVDKLFAISDRTTVSAFVGMQYLATDKGECDGLSTGSLQNLRGEIGVSAAHKATDKAYIYGELSFVGDMVRNNPTATVGDYRSRGANPGRAGLNLSVGASYQLNDSWSLNGSYSLELMQNQTSHSANVGATYSF